MNLQTWPNNTLERTAAPLLRSTVVVGVRERVVCYNVLVGGGRSSWIR